MRIENNIIIAEEGKWLNRKGRTEQFKKGLLFPNETIADYEERADLFPQEDTNYDERVNDLIRERYSLSQELAILRQRDSKVKEFAEYNAYAEECKLKAKEI